MQHECFRSALKKCFLIRFDCPFSFGCMTIRYVNKIKMQISEATQYTFATMGLIVTSKCY